MSGWKQLIQTMVVIKIAKSLYNNISSLLVVNLIITIILVEKQQMTLHGAVLSHINTKLLELHLAIGESNTLHAGLHLDIT